MRTQWESTPAGELYLGATGSGGALSNRVGAWGWLSYGTPDSISLLDQSPFISFRSQTSPKRFVEGVLLDSKRKV